VEYLLEYERELVESEFSIAFQDSIAGSLIVNAVDRALETKDDWREALNMEVMCQSLESAYADWLELWSKHPEQIKFEMFEDVCRSAIGEYSAWQEWRKSKVLN
jgi:hypothetical protein